MKEKPLPKIELSSRFIDGSNLNTSPEDRKFRPHQAKSLSSLETLKRMITDEAA
jgi:hypothetical protein